MTLAKAHVFGALESCSESALMAFGDRAQMIKACEEMGELVTALCKRLNGSPTTDGAIIDEIADVLVMACQLRVLFDPSLVDDRVLFKLNRTMEYIRNRNKGEEKGMI